MPRKSKKKNKLPAAVYDASKDKKKKTTAIPGFGSESDSDDSSEQEVGPRIQQQEALISSDEEDSSDDDANDNNNRTTADDSDDSDDSDSEDDGVGRGGNLEARARAIEKESAKEAAESHAELRRTYEEETQRQVLPNDEEIAREQQTGVSLETLHTRVQEVVATLSDFNARRDPGTSRQQYVKVLINDICTLYNYLPELVELFLDMFPVGEAVEFIEAQESDRPVVIRTNTLKTRRRELAQALTNRGVNLDPLEEWSKVGLKVYQSKVPLGATPEYLAGHYMLQSAASMLPVMALDPQPNEKILDMCSAPGGKTSYISQLMANTGTVIANDLRADRINAVVSNLHRLGVRNAVVVNYDGRAYPKIMGGFDRVLLDAPCSGLGVISRDQAVKMTRTVKDIMRTSHLQKELLRAAVDAVDAKNGAGVIVYSTCSVSVFENEMVVDYILKNRDVKIVDSGLPFGKPGFTRFKEKHFHPSLKLTRRFYPHSHNLDGFYVCRLQKMSNGVPSAGKASGAAKQTEPKEVGKKSQQPKKTKSSDSTASAAAGAPEKKRQKRRKVPLKVLKWKEEQRQARRKAKTDGKDGSNSAPASDPVASAGKPNTGKPTQKPTTTETATTKVKNAENKVAVKDSAKKKKKKKKKKVKD